MNLIGCGGEGIQLDVIEDEFNWMLQRMDSIGCGGEGIQLDVVEDEFNWM